MEEEQKTENHNEAFYRERGSATVIPEPSFTKALKSIASGLEVIWNSSIERWIVWYRGSDGRYWRIHEVKNPDGSYRPLDERLLTMLRRCDMSTKVEDPKYLISEQLRKSKEFKDKAIRDHKDDMIRKSREMKSKWDKAIENAERGIFYDHQFDNKKIQVSVPRSADRRLMEKLGVPNLQGQPILIKP